jgi:hypothetical protein
VLHFLENNYYRSTEAYDLVHVLAPDAMTWCEDVRNAHGEAPHDVRIVEVEKKEEH